MYLRSGAARRLAGRQGQRRRKQEEGEGRRDSKAGMPGGSHSRKVPGLAGAGGARVEHLGIRQLLLRALKMGGAGMGGLACKLRVQALHSWRLPSCADRVGLPGEVSCVLTCSSTTALAVCVGLPPLEGSSDLALWLSS